MSIKRLRARSIVRIQNLCATLEHEPSPAATLLERVQEEPAALLAVLRTVFGPTHGSHAMLALASMASAQEVMRIALTRNPDLRRRLDVLLNGTATDDAVAEAGAVDVVDLSLPGSSADDPFVVCRLGEVARTLLANAANCRTHVPRAPAARVWWVAAALQAGGDQPRSAIRVGRAGCGDSRPPL